VALMAFAIGQPFAAALWSLARLDGAAAVIATRVLRGRSPRRTWGALRLRVPPGQDVEVLAMTIPPECAVLWRMTCKIALLKNGTRPFAKKRDRSQYLAGSGPKLRLAIGAQAEARRCASAT
jgi:hypothetical protein